ncbi:O-acetyl-ADP-ribose deacetylase (regulator of RNase III) [Geothermobacter ehrlichii]|uniref:O-acetyl-ADP-ribose deacetylase (Regulator of RNase III) n=1 Tax=Geothermobacter ehrlichii TaxID=213224 RepID=A0A5D3WNQ9_9BACT|nr:O-acetyl-ADP-ribose deacetylase [Geothermobacter ehrlichii]TYP00165.1 O-acetyl-ADP-ribose deacetylase (regulator of RNase III) [Geothermobacter ehrlichii]
MRYRLVLGDITRLKVDAIVNAANRTLLGGGGVDGAIHRAAGPELRETCRRLGGCETGDAKMTPGFALPAAHVIHTVGPVWKGGGRDEEGLLASCYRNCLRLALENGLRSVAFPSISTGAYGFPVEKACRIALNEVAAFVDVHADAFDEIVFCCFSASDRDVYRVLMQELGLAFDQA